MCDRQVSCANCVHGDYWREPENCDSAEQFGFDCSYPHAGSKVVRDLRTTWTIDDENLAAECPEYLPETVAPQLVEASVC